MSAPNHKSETDNKITSIVVRFPQAVDLPLGFEQVLHALVNMVCEAYEADNLDRVMWPAGHGGMPNMREIFAEDGKAPMFDMSVYSIDVAERARYPKEFVRIPKATFMIAHDVKGNGSEWSSITEPSPSLKEVRAITGALGQCILVLLPNAAAIPLYKWVWVERVQTDPAGSLSRQMEWKEIYRD